MNTLYHSKILDLSAQRFVVPINTLARKHKLCVRVILQQERRSPQKSAVVLQRVIATNQSNQKSVLSHAQLGADCMARFFRGSKELSVKTIRNHDTALRPIANGTVLSNALS